MIGLGKRTYIFMLETEARAIGEVMNLEQEMPVAANQRRWHNQHLNSPRQPNCVRCSQHLRFF